MEIGYTLPGSLMKKVGLRSLRVYANGYNILTWTKDPIWGDPENLGYIGYPLTRTFNTGLNINF